MIFFLTSLSRKTLSNQLKVCKPIFDINNIGNLTMQRHFEFDVSNAEQ